MYGDNLASVSEQPGLIIRLVRRFRPATGWGVFLLSLSAVLLLPYALADGELIPGSGRTVWLALLSFVFAWWLANRRISGLAAAVIITVTGVVADLLWGVFILRPGSLASQLFARLSWAFDDRQEAEPVITFFREQWTVLGGYLQRVGLWIKGLIVGPGAPDDLAVIGLMILLTWLIAAWAAWWIVRNGQAFVAVLPTGVFLAQHAFWVPATLGYLLVFLGVTVFLLVLVRMVFTMRTWDETGVDYADDIRLDVLFSALALTLVVTFLSPTLPFFASGEFSQRFWKTFESPWRRVEQQVSASFRVAQPVRSLVPPTGAAPGGLPRAHLLGGRPELGREIALRVSVRGDPTDLQLYWRGQTYATYTGQGWETGAEQPLEQSFEAGQPWMTDLPSSEGRRPIVASVEVVAASRSVVYAPLEPIAVDRPYQALLRSPDDLIALSSQRNARTYTVLSYIPAAASATLARDGTAYPTSITSRYLQLPEGLDSRLTALAASWTEGATTEYDKAVAIERELRNITYSLDVPPPPEGHELVSWFLFDLKRGYCDYYASAMIVLARLSGIPARLAIGYARGEFDEVTGKYVVSELQAHSWPELYFQGVGWLPFEPTAGQPPIERDTEPSGVPPKIAGGPEDLSLGIAELQARAAENAATERRQAAGRWLWTVVLAVSVAWAVWLTLSTRQGIPQMVGEPVEAYDRLVTWGRRLGRPLKRGETPREYLGGLSEAVEKIAARARLRKRQAMQAATVLRTEGALLTRDVERSLFAPTGEAEQPVSKAHRLKAALRELWIARASGQSRDLS